jgi:hypothetical protein
MANGIRGLNPDKPRRLRPKDPSSIITKVIDALTKKGPEAEETELTSHASSHFNVPSEMMGLADSLQAMVQREDRGPVQVAFRPYQEDDVHTPEAARAYAQRGSPDKIVMYDEYFPRGEFDPESDRYLSGRRTLAHEFGHHDDFRRSFDDREGFEERKQISDALEQYRLTAEMPEGGFYESRNPKTGEMERVARYQGQPDQLYADAFAGAVQYLQRTHALDPDADIEQVPPHLKLMVDNLLERDIYKNHPINILTHGNTTTIRPTEGGNIIEQAKDALSDASATDIAKGVASIVIPQAIPLLYRDKLLLKKRRGGR